MTLLEHALSYAARGWRVFPCHTPLPTDPPTCSCRAPNCGAIGKHPRTRNGFQDATTDTAQITKWWTMFPDANIGGIPGSANLVAFDLDTETAIASARALGLFAEPTLEVQTGNGTHRYYHSPPLPNGATIGGIVVRSSHGYVLLPPSLHASGRRYTFLHDGPALPLPPAALAEAQKATSRAGSKERVLTAISQTRIAPGDRHASLLALAGSLAARNVEEAVAAQLVQDANEARCDPPKPVEEVQNIVAFAYAREREKYGDVARHLVIAHAPQAPQLHTTPHESNPLDEPLPGVLEDVAQWSMDCAPQPVRLYSVAAALGLASVVCARRYATTSNNYATLYFLVVGKSGTGKEHVRRSVNTILRASEYPYLIGANEWTSRSAVWSSVLTQPQSIAIVDEFGQFLGAASGGSDGATMKNGVLTAAMELFGRIDDFAITPQFSTLTLSDKQRKAADRKVIERPALSLIGLTTPDEWYDSLKGNRISSGFLNRFLVLEATTPRGDLAPADAVDPPTHVMAWVAQLLKPRFPLDLLTSVANLPPATVLTIAADAQLHFTEFRRACNRRADLLEKQRLGELPVRAAEQAMRLALISALARDPNATTVDLADAAWGVRVASYLLNQLIPSIQERLSDSPLHALRNRFLAVLKEAGEKGVTVREAARHRVFRGCTKRDRDETIQWVQEAGLAGWRDIEHKSAGRPRTALVITAITAEDEAA